MNFRGENNGRQRVAVRRHPGQYPDADAAGSYERRDGQDSRQYSLTAAESELFCEKAGRLLLGSYDRGASRPAVVVC
jgi:hypothetical protein